MTAHEPMTDHEQLELVMNDLIPMLLERIEKSELLIDRLRDYLHHETRMQLAKVVEESVHRIVEKVEAEWTGAFLPELRRTIRADVEAHLAQHVEARPAKLSDP
ncbi:MAG: hypothetical protein OEO20_11310 [Gemmatimonadota bacterium]|nr:hypothetical protein [Gemmatimonadota bacterium]MDH3291589.1 hypothetical protein [Gemmatimonadota bacterium]MDH3366492.1 hypothetical protein [Gemmatimonadota bacterium]MDH3478881.1 hypothetical protein [Gemmatimonadota bacterium]MDH3570985.1 hypothetical protein [Gemmatimonadota bacterium]